MTPIVIHRPGARYSELPRYKRAKASISQLEQLALEYKSRKAPETSARTELPGEMVAINDLVVLITTPQLALHFSSMFNPQSDFKLRSLRIPKQKAKLEQGFLKSASQQPWARRKVVFALQDGRILLVKDAVSPQCFSEVLQTVLVPFQGAHSARGLPSSVLRQPCMRITLGSATVRSVVWQRSVCANCGFINICSGGKFATSGEVRF